MHKRMVDLVAAAKLRTQTNSKRHELVGIRWVCGQASRGDEMQPVPHCAASDHDP
jgi:hypothetical protein